MNTRDRLEQLQALIKRGAPVHEIDQFVEENRDDKRFVSLVDLRAAFMAGFKRELLEYADRANAEREELIEREMQEYARELMNYASDSAKKRAKRLSAVLA